MPADSDLLFGKIAVAEKFCAEKEVNACIQMQALSKRPIPLGRRLLDNGFITEEQHAQILEIQRKRLSALDPLLKKDKASILFGRLAVRKGLLTEAQVNECLRVQGQEGEMRSLGELMVSLGFLSASHVKEILAEQQKKIMSCPACMLSYTVLTISQSPRIDCPKCKGPLQEGKPSDSVRTDAEFATKTLAAEKDAFTGRLVESSTGNDPLIAKKVAVNCTVCNRTFEGTPDSTRRLQCPFCTTRFIAKKQP